MKLYASIEFKTGDVGRYGECTDIGYVTESIKDKRNNERVKVYGTSNGKSCTRYVSRKNIVTIIPLY
jgi:hypothetical protein